MVPAKPPSCFLMKWTRPVLSDPTRSCTPAGPLQPPPRLTPDPHERHGQPYLVVTSFSPRALLAEGPPVARPQLSPVWAAESSRETNAWGLEGRPAGRPGSTSDGAVKLAPRGVRRTEDLVVWGKDSLLFKILQGSLTAILLEMATRLPRQPVKQWLGVRLVENKMHFLIFLLTLWVFSFSFLSTLGLDVF